MSSQKYQFVIDNSRVKMKNVLNSMVDSDHLDICTAFIDAYGISAVGSAAKNGELRLLIGYELSDMPIAQDIVTFQMAEEWRLFGVDPFDRQGDDEFVAAAIRALGLPNFQVGKTLLRTHSKLYATEQYGVVGSSNLTRSGIEGQRELNLFQYEPEAIARLREWFAGLWNEAKKNERLDFKEELIQWLETAKLVKFAPFHPYAKAIFERYKHRFLPLTSSPSDVDLAIFQEEGRDIALNILAEHRCCIIADAVGLGKTFIALGTMQRRAKLRSRNQRVLLVICPAQLETVWQNTARGLGINIITESMETLGHNSGVDSVNRLRELAQYTLVIVDEAHNFRNPNANRFQNLMEILQGGPTDKEVILLTATPINNSIRDLYSMYRLMTRDRDDFFQNTNLRIRSLREFFKEVEKMSAKTTDLLLETMVCRSRLDIRRRQEKGETIVIGEKEVRFPKRRMESLEYQLSTAGKIVRYDEISAAVANLTLGAYNLEKYSKKPDPNRDQTFTKLQSLFKVLLLKRLESSVVSFIATAERFLHFSDEVIKAIKEGRTLTSEEFRKLYEQNQFTLQFTEADEEDEPTVYLKELKEKPYEEYDIDKLEQDVAADRSLLNPVIEKAKSIVGENDGKIACLKNVLRGLLPKEKALIFTFYADTAEYIHQQLTSDETFLKSISHIRIEKIIGGTRPADKNRIVSEFAPKANDSPNPVHPIQVLISTDVLSEGQNLQDCGYLINYDLHFNPVRLIQRNGRIDRLFSDHDEITIANFFPEGGLEDELKIIERLQKKIEQIQANLPVDSSVIGETVKVFSLEELRRTQAGDITIFDEIDARNPINCFHEILNEVINMIQEFGIEEINKIPFGCQSNKRSTHRGVFLCVSAGKREAHKHCWWLYYKLEEDAQGKLFSKYSEPIQDPSQIIDLIRSPRPTSEEMNQPDVTPREIRWDIILDAKHRCREMLVAQYRNEIQGQIWPATHINKKIQKLFAVWPEPLPDDISQRLGRFSLEKYKNEAESILKSVREKREATELIQWLDQKLPFLESIREDNPETIPLEIVSYLELIPETEV